MRPLTKSQAADLLAAIERAEQGACAGRIIRLGAWQLLYEGALSIRDKATAEVAVERVAALWPDVEAVYGPKQRDVQDRWIGNSR